MQIISHRGLWKANDEKNKLSALKRSFDFGFGTETDIRDLNGELIISHDMPNINTKDLVKLEDFFKAYKNIDNELLLALNIKSDELQEDIDLLLKKHNIKNYFLFDMSIPDSIKYLNKGLNVFFRQSEYENEVPLYNKIKGIWLDCFNSIWYDKELIERHLMNGKKLCLVSEELHNRPHRNLWELIKYWKLNRSNNVILCTDYPELANEFFENEKNYD